MDTSQTVVLIGGIAAIAGVLYFFFGPRAGSVAVANSSKVQEVNITVKGGYQLDRIIVKLGQPVRLNFYRDETSSCSEQVVLGDFGITRTLPAFKTTVIEFTPEQLGEFTFACGMSMIRGKIVVQPE